MSNMKIIELWGDTYLVAKSDFDIVYVKMESMNAAQNGSVESPLFLELLSEKFDEVEKKC